MITLDKEQTCLLELVKASLFSYSPTIPDGVNWEKVYELAKAQCIVPLLSNSVPSEYKKGWLDLSFQSKAHFMQLLFEQNSLVKLFNTNKIPFAILKGTAAAIYFPNPSLRTFGDIDLYVTKEFFVRARQTFENNGYITIENNDRHFEYTKNGIIIELHNKFSCDHYNDIDHLIHNSFRNISEYKINNFTFPGLPTYENGLVLLGHMMQHLKDTGIGFRQIIDWMMFVHSELDDSAWEKHFKKLAIEAGLEKLAITVTFMCRKWFGLPTDITWCNEADEDVVDQILFRIFDDGNLGHDRTASEAVKHSLKKEGSFKYLQTAGIANWPLAQKYAVFRPFAWLYQLFRYGGKGITGLFTGKKVFMKNKTNMSLEELWERLE